MLASTPTTIAAHCFDRNDDRVKNLGANHYFASIMMPPTVLQSCHQQRSGDQQHSCDNCTRKSPKIAGGATSKVFHGRSLYFARIAVGNPAHDAPSMFVLADYEFTFK